MSLALPHRTTGELISGAIWNEFIDGINVISTEIGATGIMQRATSFRGLHLRSHPDADQAANKVALLALDEIVMNDGARYPSLSSVLPLTADITTSGAGGLDTGSRVAAAWYRTLLIGKSTTKAASDLRLLLHRMKDYKVDQTQTTLSTADGERQVAGNERNAQSFQVGTVGPLEVLDLNLAKNGSPTGRLWVQIEADVSGSPSGTALATSDKFDVAQFSTVASWLRFPFRLPATLATGTTYWFVIYGDFTISASHYVLVTRSASNVYANGQQKQYGSGVWSAGTGFDLAFKIYITENNVAPNANLPTGYDEYCELTPFFNNGSNVLVPFIDLSRSVRRAFANVTGLVASTAVVPTLGDASTVLPPLPLEAWLTIDGATAGDQIQVAGVPDGYAVGAAIAPSVLYQHLIAAGSISATFGPLSTNYQGLYGNNNSGARAFTVSVQGFRW